MVVAVPAGLTQCRADPDRVDGLGNIVNANHGHSEKCTDRDRGHGGLDALVFTGGVGQHAAPIRAMALERMGFVGLSVDAKANAANAMTIHSGRVPILVIPTDEERVIARATVDALHDTP